MGRDPTTGHKSEIAAYSIVSLCTKNHTSSRSCDQRTVLLLYQFYTCFVVDIIYTYCVDIECFFLLCTYEKEFFTVEFFFTCLKLHVRCSDNHILRMLAGRRYRRPYTVPLGKRSDM